MLKKRISAKPWPVHVKKRTLEILHKAKEKKTRTTLLLDEFVYFLLFFTGVIGNFVISVILVPLLLVLNGAYLYITLFLIGLAFGALINGILLEIHKIEQKRQLISGMLMGAIALINIYIMTQLANILEIKLRLLTSMHSPILVSTVYVLAFLIPHFYSEYKRRFWHL